MWEGVNWKRTQENLLGCWKRSGYRINCQLYTQDARSLLSDRRASRLRQLARPEVSGPRPLSLQRKTWRGQIRS